MEAPSPPPNPIDRLFHTVRNCGSVQCAGTHVGDKRVVAPEGAIAYCSAHRNNEDLATGWMWVSRMESRLLALLREDDSVEEALAGLVEAQEARLAEDAARAELLAAATVELNLEDDTTVSVTSDEAE